LVIAVTGKKSEGCNEADKTDQVIHLNWKTTKFSEKKAQKWHQQIDVYASAAMLV